MKPVMLSNFRKAVDKMGGDSLAFPKVGKRKGKKTEWQKWRDKLDIVFSKFIRKRDTAYGIGPCISCRKFSKLQCGHFIKRQYMGTRWNEENCHGQCVHCNYALQGNDVEFEKGIIRKCGDDVIERLRVQKQLFSKQPTINWLTLQHAHYSSLVK